MQATSTAVVDRRECVRLGVRTALEQSGRYCVDVEAAHPTALRLPGAVLGLVVAQWPVARESEQTGRRGSWVSRTPCVLLSADLDPGSAEAALEAGAMAYVLESSPVTSLLSACDDVVAGHPWVEPRLAAALIERRRHQVGDVRLSGREQEVLRLVSRGYTNPQIAARLFIGLRTVEQVRSRVRSKLGTIDKATTLDAATRLGLLS